MTNKEKSIEDIEEKIEKIWGDYDDFEVGGYEYVAFIIYCDTQDMFEDNWEEESCIEELADICINSIRMMIENGYEPHEEIMSRLDSQNAKNPPELISKYQKKFEKNNGYNSNM